MLFFVFANNIGLSQGVNGKVLFVSVNDFSAKAQSGNYVIIDLRTNKEYSEGHIQNAINIDYYDKNFILNMENYSNKPFLIYSRNSSLTDLALEKINTLKHNDIFILDNGLVAWKREGKELVR